MEQSRGYASVGSLWSPGYFRADLLPDRPVTLVLSDGRRVRGIEKSEDAFSIQIMDTQQRLQGGEDVDRPVVDVDLVQNLDDAHREAAARRVRRAGGDALARQGCEHGGAEAATGHGADGKQVLREIRAKVLHARQELGDAGEHHARRQLEASGYTCLTQQWRCPAGEHRQVACAADAPVQARC